MDDFMKIIKKLIISDSFFGNLLLTINKQADDRIPTACVSMNRDISMTLRVGPNYWKTLSEDHKIGLMIHELSHITMFHLFMFDNYANKAVFNVAADIMVHEYMQAHHIPPDSYTRDVFPELALKSKQSVEYYYNKIMSNQESIDKCGNNIDHSMWSQIENEDGTKREPSEFEKNIIRQNIENNIKEAMKAAGTAPGYIQSIIDSFKKEPAKIDWKRQIREFASRSNEVYTKTSRAKFNKRYEEDNPGMKFKNKNKILVAVDTSGSVCDQTLQEFFAQLFWILNYTGTQIDIVTADTQIHDRFTLKKNQPINITGRGGTSFTEPVELLNKENYNALIYFTDGEGSYECENRKKILWVIYNGSHHREFNHLKGKKIYVDR